MTFFELLEEIKIRKKGTYDEFSKSTNELADKNKKTLKSISNKVNEKLKEIYHPEFLKKIYKRLQHVYVYNLNRNYNAERGQVLGYKIPLDKFILAIAYNKYFSKKEKVFIQKEKEVEKHKQRTFAISTSRINKKHFLFVVLHELQHVFENDIYKLSEFLVLKRKIFFYIRKNIGLPHFLSENEFTELLTSINDIYMLGKPVYTFWGNIKNNINNKEHINGLIKIFKESKIYNTTIIDKIKDYLLK